MNGVRALIFVALGALALPAWAQSTEMYKCVEASGRYLYTNDKKATVGKKCDVLTSQINVVPGQRPAAGRPSAAVSRETARFPKESAAESASARGRQREILEKELVAEQQALAKARQDLAEQESIRTGDERNYGRVLERLQPLKDSVETHEKNIEALRRELNNLR